MGHEPSGDRQGRTTSRRRFLRAAALASTPALAGCTIQGGGFEVEIGEADDGTETPAPAQPTETPSGTPTPDGNVSMVPMPTVDPRDIPTQFPDQTPTGTPETATPEPIVVEVKNFRLDVQQASDAPLDGSNNLELIGELIVAGQPASGRARWERGLANELQIQEGSSESISMSTDPVVLTFARPHRYRLSEANVIVTGVLGDADNGANRPDKIDEQTARWPLNGEAGRQELTFSNGASQVDLRYTISRR